VDTQIGILIAEHFLAQLGGSAGKLVSNFRDQAVNRILQVNHNCSIAE
jgi:hypothetical protein